MLALSTTSLISSDFPAFALAATFSLGPDTQKILHDIIMTTETQWCVRGVRGVPMTTIEEIFSPYKERVNYGC
jgi:hypothetical protein